MQSRDDGKYDVKSVTTRDLETLCHEVLEQLDEQRPAHSVHRLFLGGGGKDTSTKTAYRDFMYKHISQVTGQAVRKDQVVLRKELPVGVGSKISPMFKSTRVRKNNPTVTPPKYDDMFRHNDE